MDLFTLGMLIYTVFTSVDEYKELKLDAESKVLYTQWRAGVLVDKSLSFQTKNRRRSVPSNFGYGKNWQDDEIEKKEDPDVGVNVCLLRMLRELKLRKLMQNTDVIFELVEGRLLTTLVLVRKLDRQTLTQNADTILCVLRKAPEVCVRVEALRTIGMMDPKALKQNANEILGLLKDSEARVRVAALHTMGKMDPKEWKQNANEILGLLKDPEASVRDAARATIKRWENKFNLELGRQ